jgi:hypothetical protein
MGDNGGSRIIQEDRNIAIICTETNLTVLCLEEESYKVKKQEVLSKSTPENCSIRSRIESKPIKRLKQLEQGEYRRTGIIKHQG